MTTDDTTHEAAAAAARLRAWFQDTAGPMVMGEADFDDVEIVLGAYERAVVEREQLHPEYGLRVVYTNTLEAEGAVGETLGDALAAIDQLDAQPDGVLHRTIIQRPVGAWREIGDGRG